MPTSQSRYRRSARFLAATLSLAFTTAVASTQSTIADETAPSQPSQEPRAKYVEAPEQLIVELYVRNVKQSTALYEQLGFKALRKEPTFVELGWDDSRLYLEQIPGQPEPPATVVCNIRIMVSDVDHYWKLCQDLKLPVRRAIGNRYYGLRDFTVIATDGIGLRFATKLGKKAAP